MDTRHNSAHESTYETGSPIASMLAEADRALKDVEPAAFLVVPRVVRRVIKQEWELPKLTVQVPHRKAWLVSRYDLLKHVDWDELGLEPGSDLPDTALLLARPDDKHLETMSLAQLKRQVWRLLFHSRIHLEFDRLRETETLSSSDFRKRIHELGQVEFDEIHSVLRREHFIQAGTPVEDVFVEFAALYSELKHFAPHCLPSYFPSFADHQTVDELLSRDIDIDALLQQTRLADSPDVIGADGTERDETTDELDSLTGHISHETHDLTDHDDETKSGLDSERHAFPRLEQHVLDALVDERKPNHRTFSRLIRKADRAFARGNAVGAALAQMKATRYAAPELVVDGISGALTDIQRLVKRLQESLQFSVKDAQAWYRTLVELLIHAHQGFWNADKKLLYDLQKVCVDHEREIYTVDVSAWAFSFGNRPIKRALPNQSEVLMSKHLRSATRRLVAARLSGEERRVLSKLLHEAAESAERQMRTRLRPFTVESLENVGLVPQNIPEKVAVGKLIEELLDVVAVRGFLTMGDMRDAISRSNLKLPDLSGPVEFFAGDKLLLADRKLSRTLDGVYQRGDFYLRWLQRLSAASFGTGIGRFITRFIAIPYGSAYIAYEAVLHIVHLFTGHGHGDERKSITDGSPENGQQGTASDGSESNGDAANDNKAGSANSESAVNASTAGSGNERDNSASDDADGEPDNSPAGDDIAGQEADAGNDAAQTSRDSNPEEPGYPDEAVDLVASVKQEPAPSGTSSLKTLIDDPAVAVVLSLGTLLLLIIHVAPFRRFIGSLFSHLFSILRTVLYEWPVRLAKNPSVRRFLRSSLARYIRKFLLTPLIPTFLICWVVPRFYDTVPTQPWMNWIIVLAAMSIILNSRVGRDVEELSQEWAHRTWHRIRAHIFVALFDLIMETFKRMLEWFERVLYAVDEWLRFKSGETSVSLTIKATLGIFWSAVTFFLRFCVNLLIEPQINPIKHFPVVTVSHKIILPLGIPGGPLSNLIRPLTGDYSDAIAGTTIFLIPGVFGFVAWELKSNWQLYKANRSKKLKPVVVGSHGETFIRLMKPGFHSGTLPKLFARLRRVDRRRAAGEHSLARSKYLDRLHHVHVDVERFVTRELLRLLRETEDWSVDDLRVDQIRLASNNIRIELACPSLSDEPLLLVFEEQSGWLVANAFDSGWVRELTEADRATLLTALIGFYRMCGVDLVREQIDSCFAPRVLPYDVTEDGLLVWPDVHYEKEAVYNLHHLHSIRPYPRAVARDYSLPAMPPQKLIFAETRLAWQDWAVQWEPGHEQKPAVIAEEHSWNWTMGSNEDESPAGK